jgi:hypothetical protein
MYHHGISIEVAWFLLMKENRKTQVGITFHHRHLIRMAEMEDVLQNLLA